MLIRELEFAELLDEIHYTHLDNITCTLVQARTQSSKNRSIQAVVGHTFYSLRSSLLLLGQDTPDRKSQILALGA